MEYRIRDEFSEKKGIISNSCGFLSTYLDTNFKDKWNGYWSPSYKYLDYFAVKVNGVWLDQNNLVETKYGDTITYIHEIPGMKIVQEIKTPEALNGFELEIEKFNKSGAKKAVRTSIEVAADIRPRTKDLGPKQYNLTKLTNGIKIEKDEKQFSITSENFKIEEHNYIKEHYPNEKQRCIVLEDISCMCEIDSHGSDKAKISFEISEDVENVQINQDSRIKNSEHSRPFNQSISSLENLYYGKNGSGVIAGHPWFQNYWARDSFWASLGMIDAGMFEAVERLLKNFADRNNFPSKIHTNGGEESEYPRSDSIPLFAIAVDELNKVYDIDKDLKEITNEILSENRPKTKLVDHDPKGTWMDTLKRGKAVDIQSLWIEALDRHNRGTKMLKSGLDEFKNERYMSDNLKSDFESINPTIPLMFDQISSEKAEIYLTKINGEFSSRFGARTRSVVDPGYNSTGYHTGSVWGLTTCWAAAANLNYNKTEHGLNFLRKLGSFIDENQLGALPELVDAEEGANLGCDEQAWSAGMFVHVIDSYLLGIEVKNGIMYVDPKDGVELVRENKRIGNEKIDIKVKNGEFEILNSPEIEIRGK